MNLIIMKFLKINKIARYNPCKKKNHYGRTQSFTDYFNKISYLKQNHEAT